MLYQPTFTPSDAPDSYDIQYKAAQHIKGVPGLTCEIGLFCGAGSESIMQGCIDNNDYRTHIAIDPYGNIPYYCNDGNSPVQLGYDNQKKHTTLPKLHTWANEHNTDFIFFNMEDTEFFKRFSDGVPVYDSDILRIAISGYKRVINQYALVYFDGPHSLKIVLNEIDFFMPRTPPGGIWIFDNINYYDHASIEKVILKKMKEIVLCDELSKKYTTTRKTYQMLDITKNIDYYKSFSENDEDDMVFVNKRTFQQKSQYFLKQIFLFFC